VTVFVKILGYFKERILFLTVSQSPNVEQLRAKIWGFISGNEAIELESANFFVFSVCFPELESANIWRS